ncbi:MAG: glycosyltransferase family 61 protein [Pikeienuella sp.]
MANMDFEVRSLDDLLAHGPKTRIAPGVFFESRGTIDFEPSRDIFLRSSAPNDLIYDTQTTAQANKAVGTPTGWLTFKNALLVGPLGMIFDLENRVLWRGDCINWSPALFLHLRFGRQPIYPRERGEIVSIDTKAIDKARREAETTLWSGPGFQIYGHWLIDYIARRLAISDLPGAEDVNVYHKSFQPWQKSISKTLGWHSGLFGAGGVSGYKISRHEELRVPTFLRRHRRFDTERTNAAWDLTKETLLAAPGARNHPDFGPRIYISRAEFKRERRNLANAEVLEAAVRDAGYRAVAPEKFTPAQQVSIMSRAESIVGMDGSGLHNSIFAPKGMRMSVIGAKKNVYHAAISQMRGHKIDYVMADILEHRRRDAVNKKPPTMLLQLDGAAIRESLEVISG